MDQMGWPPLQPPEKVQNDPSQELETGADTIIIVVHVFWDFVFEPNSTP
jgi:hypothetical protein